LRTSTATFNTFTCFRFFTHSDLSNNQIKKVAADAFHGLKSLESLYASFFLFWYLLNNILFHLTTTINKNIFDCRVLYGNKITELPAGLFQGLTNLQLLWVNKNRKSDKFNEYCLKLKWIIARKSVLLKLINWSRYSFLLHDARSTLKRQKLIIHIRTTEENVFIHGFTYCSRFPVKHATRQLLEIMAKLIVSGYWMPMRYHAYEQTCSKT